MYPDRRRIPYFDERGEDHHNQAEKEDHKDRRAISRILCRKVETTYLTRLPHAEQPGKQPASAATRTSAAKRRAPSRNCGAIVAALWRIFHRPSFSRPPRRRR